MSERASQRDTTRRILRSLAGVSGLGILHKLLGLAVALVLARHLGTYGYGQYAFVTSLVALFGVVSAFGVPPVTMREVARHHAAGDEAQLRGQMRSSWRVTRVTILAALAAAFLLFPFGKWLAAFDRPTYLVALLLLPVTAALMLICAQLQGLRQVVQSALPGQFVQPLAMLVLVIGLVLVVGAKLGPAQAMALNVGTTVLALGFAWGRLRQYFPAQLPGREDDEAADQTLQSQLSVLLPFVLLGGLAFVNSRADVVMLGALASADDVGIYRVAFQGAQLVSFPMLMIGAAFAPEIAAFGRPAPREALGRLLALASLISAAGALVALAVAYFAGEWGILLVLGEVYLPAYLPLLILGAANLATGLFGPIAMVLNMQGHERGAVKAGIFSAVTNIALNALFIPQYGMVGASVATAASLLVWNILLGLLLLRRTGLLPGPLSMLSARLSD